MKIVDLGERSATLFRILTMFIISLLRMNEKHFFFMSFFAVVLRFLCNDIFFLNLFHVTAFFRLDTFNVSCVGLPLC